MATDLEIARAATLRPIGAIAARAGIPEDALIPFGKYKAKVDLGFVQERMGSPPGRLVLVTGINPTAAGEGKTTTTVGLGDALNALGTKTMICLREPSLGPCFGVKGGATGGGRAQVAPMEDINLHFTGDFHAITSANNLLAAMIDNHLYWGNALGLDAAPHHLAARHRHERPSAAQRGVLARRRGQRLPAGGRLRHHRGVRGDGDLLPGDRPCGSAGTARPHHHRHARATAPPSPRAT